MDNFLWTVVEVFDMRVLLLVGVALALTVGAIGFMGCDARSQVALEKVTNSIDAMLGKLDVSKKQIEMNITALRKGISELQTAKAKATVKVKQIDSRVQPVQAELEKTKAAMAKLSEYVKAGTTVDLGGKSYDPDQLKKMAGDALKRYKDLEGQVKDLESTKPSLEKVVVMLDRKLEDYSGKLVALETQMKKVEAKLVALKAIQETSATLGDSDGSLASNVEKLQDDLNDLDAEVEAGLLREDEKFNATATEKQIDAVDGFIQDVNAGAADPLSEIDAILGGDSGK